MRKALTAITTVLVLVLALAGSALANNPPGDPLPVNGEPDCFGARVSHSASEHGLTPKAKIDATHATLGFLALPGVNPPWEDTYISYYEANGVSVQSIQAWIRANCSDDPIIANP